MAETTRTHLALCSAITVLVICALFSLPHVAYASESQESLAPEATEAIVLDASTIQAKDAFQAKDALEQQSTDEGDAAIADERLSDGENAPEPQVAPASSDSNNSLSAQSESIPAAKLNIEAHVQNIGDQGWREAGSSYDARAMAGTSGRALRMESIEIKLNSSIPGSVQYQAHVQNDGWQAVCADGQRAGTKGRSLRVEGLSIALIGEVSRYYDVMYRVHVQNDGWQEWKKNGQYAGTTGSSLRLEAIEIYLKQKDEPASQQNEGIVGIVARAHVQNDGWQPGASAGANAGITTGTSGRSLRMEALAIWLNPGRYEGGITYQAHVQNIGWQDTKANGTAAGTSGRGLRMEALQINLYGEIAQHFDVMYRAHVQNIGWQPWTFNNGLAGTTGKALRVEALQIKLMRKGSTSLDDGGYVITTILDPNMALDDPGASEAAGAQMQVYARNDGYAQRFYLKNVGNGDVTLQSAASALFLTDSTGAVRQLGESGTVDQRWHLFWDAGYNIVNVGTGKSFALVAAPGNGVAVNAAPKNTASPNQHWMFEETGIAPNGTYVITNVPSGRVLDVWGRDRKNGGEVKIGSLIGGNNQKFTIAYLGSNQYSIRNAVTNRAMQVSGTNVNMWSYAGPANKNGALKLPGQAHSDSLTSGTARPWMWQTDRPQTARRC